MIEFLKSVLNSTQIDWSDFNVFTRTIDGVMVTLCLYDMSIIGESGMTLDVSWGGGDPSDGPHVSYHSHGNGWVQGFDGFESGMSYDRDVVHSHTDQIEKVLRLPGLTF